VENHLPSPHKEESTRVQESEEKVKVSKDDANGDKQLAEPTW